MTLLARDERGRTYAGYDPARWGTSARLDYRFFLNLPKDAHRLELTVAVQTMRFVEFLARPSPPRHEGSAVD